MSNHNDLDEKMAEVIKECINIKTVEENLEFITFEDNTLKYTADKKKMPEDLKTMIKQAVKEDFDFKTASGITNIERRKEYIEVNDLENELHSITNDVIKEYYSDLEEEIEKEISSNRYEGQIQEEIDTLFENEDSALLDDDRTDDEIIQDVKSFKIFIKIESMDEVLYDNDALLELTNEDGAIK